MSNFLPILLLMGLLWFPSQKRVNLSSNSNHSTGNVVYEPPQFPGGMSKFTDYVKKNLRYPKAARKAKLEGRVQVNFVVTDEGLIKDVKLFNSLGLGTDEEAIRLIETMPNWVPGKKDGKPVHMPYSLTIEFALK